MVILDDGALLGRCRVRSLIFRASLFDVYSATDDRGVAVCVLHREHRGRPIPSEAAFNAELENLRALRIDQFPRVLGGGRDDQSSWLVTGAIGGTVPIWTPGAAPVHWLRALLTLGRSNADCFMKAAEVGIYHGTLTPDCLRKWPNGAPCIVGIGAARLFGLDTGTLRAAPRYCAPEQFGEDAIPSSDRTDVYSLGLCLFAFLTGREPFEGAAGLELISLANHGSPDLSLLRETPDKIRELLARCCAKSTADRYGWAGFAEAVAITVTLCEGEVPDATRMEIITEKLNQLDRETLGKLTKRWDAEDADEDDDDDDDDEEPDSTDPSVTDTNADPAGDVAGPLLLPIATPALIASAPSNEAHGPTPDQPQPSSQNEPSRGLAKEAPDEAPPPLETPAVSPPKKQRKGPARTLVDLAMFGGVCAALVVAIMNNNRAAPPAQSGSQEKLEAVAWRLMEAIAACKVASGGQPKVEDPITGPTVGEARANSAEPARPVSRLAPALPRGIDSDTLKGSCGTWFNCEPISEETR
jgi:hypothetical protein